MQANFMESNPMPVKAVLAMMGRIEEVLRLPMLPVKPKRAPSWKRLLLKSACCRSTLRCQISKKENN